MDKSNVDKRLIQRYNAGFPSVIRRLVESKMVSDDNYRVRQQGLTRIVHLLTYHDEETNQASVECGKVYSKGVARWSRDPSEVTCVKCKEK